MTSSSSPPPISLLSLFPPAPAPLSESSYPPGGAYYSILALLEEHGQLSTKQVEEGLSLSQSMINRALVVLHKRGEVAQVKPANAKRGLAAIWQRAASRPAPEEK
jgi:predicted ArsR family transcriptional regulator